MLCSLVLVHTTVSSATAPASRELALVGSIENKEFAYIMWNDVMP